MGFVDWVVETLAWFLLRRRERREGFFAWWVVVVGLVVRAILRCGVLSC